MAQLMKRGFSTSAALAKAQLVKTPIQVHGVEGRYAAALYSAGHKQNKLDQISTDLNNVRSVYKDNKKFQEFVLDPTLKANKKKTAIEAISTKLGLTKETGNFLGLLAENGRLNKLESVVSSFESIMRAHRGELFVQVTSAEELSSSNQKALSDALSKIGKSGQKLTVTYAVKPSILGGLVVTIGDKYVDLSIASRVKKYKDALATAI
ncbi:Oligomycin sensitivity conferral protein [Caenorhabditis elegans]|nr:ATP synthase subunit O, mitochondrial [Caenorhabditis elegans]CCD66287.1 ATP synthase subunit O, mitochondrial [Caenorhabditis elegans]|eukprot:NP_001021420.1 ATP synthase subunit [Caenorhabditis elegans]